jgi:predicted HicB family RNase H-like nuclease
MNKDLEYYMRLPYIIEVVPIPDSEGSGYTAQLPQLGRFAIVGDGETPEEAIADLEITKRQRFAAYLESGVKIPEPDTDKEEYSGRFVVRIPKILHRHLVESAKSNEVSLNQFVTYLLSTNFQIENNEGLYNDILDRISYMSEAIWDIRYSFIDGYMDEGIPEIEKELEKQDDVTLPILVA